jgi:hypothetical protein
MEVSGQLHASAALPLGQSPGTHWIGAWVGPRAVLNAVVKRKILHCRESSSGISACSPSLYRLSYPHSLNKKFWEELIAYFPLIRHGPHTKKDFSYNSFVACIFVAAVAFLLIRCLATIEGYIHIYIDRVMGGIYEIRRWCHDMHTKFHKDWFSHSKLIEGHTNTQTV